jgi:hypothetical protein
MHIFCYYLICCLLGSSLSFMAAIKPSIDFSAQIMRGAVNETVKLSIGFMEFLILTFETLFLFKNPLCVLLLLLLAPVDTLLIFLPLL